MACNIRQFLAIQVKYNVFVLCNGNILICVSQQSNGIAIVQLLQQRQTAYRITDIALASATAVILQPSNTGAGHPYRS